MSFNVQVKKIDLMEALRCQQSVIDRKATQPIYSHVKLETINGKLKIEGSDGNLILNYTIDAKITHEGIVTVPAQIFYNLVRKSNKELISLNQEEDVIVIDYGSGTFKLNILDHNSFPEIPEISDKLTFSMNSFEFVQYVKMIKIAMATDDIRAYFNGIYLESDGNEIRFVATDAHKLAVYKKEIKFEKFNMILSKKSVETLIALISKDENIKCYKHENYVKFSSDNFTFISRLVHGSFPANYMDLIPNCVSGKFVSDVDELKESLDRISILSSNLSRIVKVQLGDKCVVKCDNVSYGSGEENLSGKYDGPEFIFGIDCNFWLDFLRLFDGGNIKLEYHSDQNGANKPIVMQHEHHKKFTYIAMPIALENNAN